MTDHADTIRSTVEHWRTVDWLRANTTRQREAQGVLDALVALRAERQQAIDERQQVIESRKAWILKADALLVELQRVEAERDLVYAELNKALGEHAPQAWDRIKAALDA